MKLNTENTTCRNCQTEMPEQSLYCPKCSQKNTDGRIPILSFVKDLLENLFSLDSKLFKTSLGLFIPGKLTKEFFTGKHKSFATPSRLFLASAILFFAMVSIVVQKEVKLDDFKGNIFGLSATNKSKKEQLAQLEKMRINLGKEVDEKTKSILDSMEIQIQNSAIDSSTIDVELWNNTYKILSSDIGDLSADSLIQKYQIEGVADQILFKQGHKLTKDPKSLMFLLISNLTWMMLLLIPSMALIFKLLYIRRKKYYVEHLVFLFHIHAFILLIGTGLLIINYFEFTSDQNEFFLLLIPIFYLYALIAMKKVYGQGWFKTFFKSILILISYFFLLLICFILISVISFILF